MGAFGSDVFGSCRHSFEVRANKKRGEGAGKIIEKDVIMVKCKKSGRLVVLIYGQNSFSNGTEQTIL